jgi:uncharacterized protein YxeA
MKKIFLIIVSMLLLISCVSATITINVDSKDATFIKWSWSANTTEVSIDGYKVVLMDLNANKFILSELGPNTTHSIRVTSLTDTGYLETTTLPVPPAPLDFALNIIAAYIFFIGAIICIVIGLRMPIIAWLGAGLSICGIVDMITISFWSGFVFMVITCASIMVAMQGE